MQFLTTEPFLKNEHLKTRIRSPLFFVVLLFLPACVYCLGRLFEDKIAAMVVPLFPAEKNKGFLFYLDFVQLCLNEVLWLSFFCILVWWMTAVPGRLTKGHFRLSTSHGHVLALVALYF